jgi:hypothetical protein
MMVKEFAKRKGEMEERRRGMEQCVFGSQNFK